MYVEDEKKQNHKILKIASILKYFFSLPIYKTATKVPYTHMPTATFTNNISNQENVFYVIPLDYDTRGITKLLDHKNENNAAIVPLSTDTLPPFEILLDELKAMDFDLYMSYSYEVHYQLENIINDPTDSDLMTHAAWEIFVHGDVAALRSAYAVVLSHYPDLSKPLAAVCDTISPTWEN